MLTIEEHTLVGGLGSAVAETEVTARREQAWLGHDLNAVALRGDARLAQSNFAGALAAYGDVVRRTQGWRLPTGFSAPPATCRRWWP